MTLLAEKADITYNPKITNPNTLVKYIQDIGFDAELLEMHEAPTEHRLDLIVRFYFFKCSTSNSHHS